MARKSPVTNVVCFGDSITAAHGAERHRWPVILQYRLEEWRPGCYNVYTQGSGGHTTAQGLERMESEVLVHMPGVVIIEFGLNDANCRPWQTKPRVSLSEYTENLLSIGRMVRSRKGIPVFTVNHPVYGPCGAQGDGRSYPRRVDSYNQAIRRVARTLKAGLIDLPALMRARRVDPKVFYQDCVHLSPEGNRIYAGLVFERLTRILPE
jgi:acyl-CoA thioesterase-1